MSVRVLWGVTLLAGGCLALSPAASARPVAVKALKLYVNGQPVKIVPIKGGSDDYAQLHANTMMVEARWTGDAAGSGYAVRLSTDEPKTKVYATCTSGTSCRIPKPAPLGLDIEVSWHVEILKGKKVVAGWKYCLVRYE